MRKISLNSKIFANNALIIEMKSHELEKYLQDKVESNQKIVMKKEEPYPTLEELPTGESTKDLDEAIPEDDKTSPKSKIELPTSALREKGTFSTKKNSNNIAGFRPGFLLNKSLS